MRKHKFLSVALVFGIMMCVIQTVSAAKLMKKKIYDVVLKDSTNRKASTDKIFSQNGNTIMVFFGEWCASCHREMDTLNNHLSDLKGRYNTNTIAVALYPDKTSPEHITKTSKKNGWNLPLFFDVYDDAHTLYRIKEIPHLMVVDKEGNLVYEKRGYSPEFYSELEDALKELNQ